MRKRLIVAALAALLIGGCAYYNALYNAERAFEEAERAAARGENSNALNEYGIAIEKAERSLKRDPDGRWSDDARFLIARAHFGRGDISAARPVLEQVLAESGDDGLKAGADAYLGAVDVHEGREEEGIERLSAALAAQPDPGMQAFAHLWRGRARLALGKDAGWQDLDTAAEIPSPAGTAALLERATWAAQSDDFELARNSFAAIFARGETSRWSDSLRILTRRAVTHFGAARARELIVPEQGPWIAADRDRMALFRVELAVLAGDTVGAMAEARAVAERATGQTADAARVALARLHLGAARETGDLNDIRSALLPAIANTEAQRLIRDIKALGVLLERAQGGQPLALFAAAELARDELRSPRLARSLFQAYAALAPDAVYAPKAQLAANALAPAGEDVQAPRVAARDTTNVYIAAMYGGGGDGFKVAEEHLQKALATLRADAARIADQRDASVRTTVAHLDSVRAVARRDSVSLSCGLMLDSLAIGGMRGDSIRAACIRGATLRMDSIIADSLYLRPAATDTARNRTRLLIPDTTDL